MRFADRLWCPCLSAAVCAAVAGCASSPGQPPVAAATASVLAPAPASVPAPEPPKPAIESAVPATAQRAFDDARRALAAGRVDEAERTFRSLARSNPELGGPHANLGLLHLQAGRPAEAVVALEQAVLASPQQAVYFNQLGIAYRQHGQFGQARDAYERAIALDPGYPAPLLNLGILLDLYLRDGQRALELYDRYLALSGTTDSRVTKWVADLRNRKPDKTLLSRREPQ